MPYSPDTDLGAHRQWDLEFTHVATGVKMICSIVNVTGTEAQKDAVFQAFLDRVSGLAGVVINSAMKSTVYQSTVTPT